MNNPDDSQEQIKAYNNTTTRSDNIEPRGIGDFREKMSFFVIKGFKKGCAFCVSFHAAPRLSSLKTRKRSLPT